MDHIEILHHRYANALFEVALSRKDRPSYSFKGRVLSRQKEDDVLNDLDFLSGFLEKDERTAKFLYNPQIEDEKKIDVLSSIAKEKDFSSEFVDFLKLVVRKKRLKLLHGILLCYKDFYDMHKNRVVVSLRSAYRLDQFQIKRLKDALSRRLGKTVLIEHSLEPSLIGGFLLKFGTKIYDTSLKTRLLKLKEAMTS